MPAVVRLNDGEATEIAENALRDQFDAYGFDHVEVRSGQDSDGDEALFVTAHIGADVGLLSGSVLAKAHGILHDGLLARGERRFPYFKVRRLGDAPMDGDAPARAS